MSSGRSDAEGGRQGRSADGTSGPRGPQDGPVDAEGHTGADAGASETGWWITPLVVGLACLGLLIGGIVIQVGATSNQRDLTATTTGSILAGAWETSDTDCRTGGGSCSTEYDCHVEYQFTPAGQSGAEPVRGDSVDDGHCGDDQAKGAHRTVYYDPDDPFRNIVNDPQTFGNKYAGLFVIGGGCLGILYAVAKVVRVRRKDRAARSEVADPTTGRASDE